MTCDTASSTAVTSVSVNEQRAWMSRRNSSVDLSHLGGDGDEGFYLPEIWSYESDSQTNQTNSHSSNCVKGYIIR